MRRPAPLPTILAVLLALSGMPAAAAALNPWSGEAPPESPQADATASMLGSLDTRLDMGTIRWSGRPTSIGPAIRTDAGTATAALRLGTADGPGLDPADAGVVRPSDAIAPSFTHPTIQLDRVDDSTAARPIVVVSAPLLPPLPVAASESAETAPAENRAATSQVAPATGAAFAPLVLGGAAALVAAAAGVLFIRLRRRDEPA